MCSGSQASIGSLGSPFTSCSASVSAPAAYSTRPSNGDGRMARQAPERIASSHSVTPTRYGGTSIHDTTGPEDRRRGRRARAPRLRGAPRLHRERRHDGARHRGPYLPLRPGWARRSSSSTTRSPAVSSARSAARPRPPAAAPQALVGRRPRPRGRCRPRSLAASASRSSTGSSATAWSATAARWQQPMSIRVDGLPVAPQRAELAEAFPAATPRLVVFLHGLMAVRARVAPRRLGPRGLRHAARPRPRRHARLRPLQQRPPHLRERPLAGRAARGRRRRVAGRGRGGRARRPLDGRPGLAQRLPLRRARRRGWVGTVRQVVSLGSPHMGAPLEQAVHYAASRSAGCPRRG